MRALSAFRRNLTVLAAPLVLLALTTLEVNTQELAKNAMYVEILGHGLFYSVNYDRVVVHDDVSLRVGAMIISGESNDPGAEAKATLKMFPIVLTRLVGSDRHKLELGIGATIVTSKREGPEGAVWESKFPIPSTSGTTVVGTASLGYRYQKQSGGLVFRAGLSPFFTFEKFLPWGGLSIGYSF